MTFAYPKIILQEHDAFMKKEDTLAKKQHEFSFIFHNKKSRDNSVRKFLKNIDKKDLVTLKKTSSQLFYENKFSSKIFYEFEFTLHVRNSHRIMVLCTVKGLAIGHGGPKKEFRRPSKKKIESNISNMKKTEKLCKKELSLLSVKELKGLEKNLILGDKLVRKIKKHSKSNAMGIWTDLCNFSKEMTAKK